MAKRKKKQTRPRPKSGARRASRGRPSSGPPWQQRGRGTSSPSRYPSKDERGFFEPEPVAVDAEGGPNVANGRLLLNPAGFGFVERSDGTEPSIFIPPPNRGGGMDGDQVVVTFWPASRGLEGKVRSVLERKRTRITGVLAKDGRRWVLEPDDPRILGRAEVLGERPGGALGQVMVGAIVDYPDPWNENFTVHLEQILGPPGSLATEEFKILVEHGIDPVLPPKVLEAAESVPTRVLKHDRDNRDDLRDLEFMTIDPPDARDFDDAVCVEVQGKDLSKATMRVHVAVADVSAYVTEGDVFDEEARTRCFSVYLPDRAIPMLPEPLSSGICSLVPKKDRLAMVVSFDLEPTGKVSEAEVRAAVIRSRMRLTYDQVAAVLSKGGRLPPAVRQRILVLRKAADRLRGMRRRRGSIELNLPEIKVYLDEDDPERIRDIAPARPSSEMVKAYNLIEEFMLAANEGVARLAVKHRLPVVYRIHDRPDEERVERFTGVADLLAVDVESEKLQTPKGFQAFLKRIDSHPRRDALHSLLLRTLAQAEYATNNVGHFALASTAYLHFTSPIRRYPDLINHRVMKAWLSRKGALAGAEPIPKMPAMRDSTEQASKSSERERAAAQAERDAKALFAALHMRDRIGDRFDGTVSGLSAAGVYITLDAPPVDGMVRRNAIERETRETYELDELGARMVGTKTGRTVTVGDRVVVEVIGVNLQRRQIELALMGQVSG